MASGQKALSVLRSLTASEVEQYSIRDFQGFIFYQYNVIRVQVGLFPLLNLTIKKQITSVY